MKTAKWERTGTVSDKISYGLQLENTIKNLRAQRDALLEACKRAAMSQHHPACPIATGQGQTSITHDDCTCHVGVARAAIAKAVGDGNA